MRDRREEDEMRKDIRTKDLGERAENAGAGGKRVERNNDMME
jgi:hypothetical protein